jgi:hypothetical protein
MLAVTRTALARRAYAPALALARTALALPALARLMLMQPVRARRAPVRPVVAQVPTVLRVPVLALPAWMGPRPAAPLASHRLRRVSAG